MLPSSETIWDGWDVESEFDSFYRSVFPVP